MNENVRVVSGHNFIRQNESQPWQCECGAKFDWFVFGKVGLTPVGFEGEFRCPNSTTDDDTGRAA